MAQSSMMLRQLHKILDSHYQIRMNKQSQYQSLFAVYMMQSTRQIHMIRNESEE